MVTIKMTKNHRPTIDKLSLNAVEATILCNGNGKNIETNSFNANSLTLNPLEFVNVRLPHH